MDLLRVLLYRQGQCHTTTERAANQIAGMLWRLSRVENLQRLVPKAQAWVRHHQSHCQPSYHQSCDQPCKLVCGRMRERASHGFPAALADDFGHVFTTFFRFVLALHISPSKPSSSAIRYLPSMHVRQATSMSTISSGIACATCVRPLLVHLTIRSLSTYPGCVRLGPGFLFTSPAHYLTRGSTRAPEDGANRLLWAGISMALNRQARYRDEVRFDMK